MTGVSKLEFLCDAIAEYVGSHDPRSEAYKARNPLGLKEIRMLPGESGKKVIQFGMMRTYRSWVHGLESCIFDLRIKCSGKSSCGLTQYSTLAELVSYYGIAESDADHVAGFLSVALEGAVTRETKLFIFLR